MATDALFGRSPSLHDAENWLLLRTGALLLLVGASRRSVGGALVAMSSAPLLYRGVTGHRPVLANGFTHPAGLRVAWDAEIINEVDHKLIACRSLPGSDVVTAGSVNFASARGARSTEVRVHVQYAPPAGKAGALIASLFGREPSHTIREDLRRFKQLLEAGEIPRATSTT